jgi:hypothetical protein
MATITVHHWADPGAGLAEMARVARQRVVLLTLDPAPTDDAWLVRDYFPFLQRLHRELMIPVDDLIAMLPNATVEAVPGPRLCSDGFWCALWDRPEMHLDPEVRCGSSGWHRMPQLEMESGLALLEADLASGRWDERNGHLREDTPELDIGLRLIVAELG